ncbi:MAG: hypothetical protein JWN57_2634 [Frankiales bacterium]|jgi:hypothetical protein|nr:hypothetical protein [Frankiales bacterium]
MSETSSTPATGAGTTRPAGDGVDDKEMASEVADQTSSDLAVEGAFERESDGATSDVEAAKESADDAS